MTDDLLAQLMTQKAEIAARTDLSPEERKKRLRTIRKKIRSLGGSNRAEPEEPQYDEEGNLITPVGRTRNRSRSEGKARANTKTQEEVDFWVEEITKYLAEGLGLSQKSVSETRTAGPALMYDLRQACELDVEGPSIVRKFMGQVKRSPTWFNISWQFEHSQPLLLLGPVNRGIGTPEFEETE